MMNDLSPEARALLQAGRLGEDPSDQDESRLRRMLVARIGAGAFAASAGTAVALSSATAGATASVAAATSAAAIGGVGGVVGSFVVGSALAVAVIAWPAASPRQQSSKPVVHLAMSASVPAPPVRARQQVPDEVDDPAPVDGPPAPVVASAPAPSRDRRAVAATATPVARTEASSSTVVPPPALERTTVAAEVDLLRTAQEQLRAGNPAGALALLDQHANRFPMGVLAGERRVARARALCAMGFRDQAQRETEAFARVAPGSPLLDPMRRACPGESR